MEKWQVVKDALTSAGSLGFSSHHQPNWFMDSLKYLEPLLARRNEAYSKWIDTGNPEDLVIFKMARGELAAGSQGGKE